LFRLWQCPQCQSIHSIDPVDFGEIYKGYPLNQRSLDVFALGTLKNLLARLENLGLRKSAMIIDYGCGNGVFLEFLKRKGYTNCSGYDPFVVQYAELPNRSARFDWIILNDTIEHVGNIRETLVDCASRLESGGLLYIGTPDVRGVDMQNLDAQITKLHQPFHRVLLTLPMLKLLARELNLEPVCSWNRSYLDTLIPFANYRFLDELCKACDHNLDSALSVNTGSLFLRKPALLFWAIFGYFFPTAYEPALVLRKP
jgi:SAM-dependent methyltransferase